MKYGIITDIHSNILALKIVLKKFEESKVNKIIDIFFGGRHFSIA